VTLSHIVGWVGVVWPATTEKSQNNFPARGTVTHFANYETSGTTPFLNCGVLNMSEKLYYATPMKNARRVRRVTKAEAAFVAEKLEGMSPEQIEAMLIERFRKLDYRGQKRLMRRTEVFYAGGAKNTERLHRDVWTVMKSEWDSQVPRKRGRRKL
jgi:hypothetical protein